MRRVQKKCNQTAPSFCILYKQCIEFLVILLQNHSKTNKLAIDPKSDAHYPLANFLLFSDSFCLIMSCVCSPPLQKIALFYRP